MAELSYIIAGSGGNCCTARCRYCSADIYEKDDLKNQMKKISINFERMKNLLDKNPILQNALNTGEELTINGWSGEPLLYWKEHEMIMDWFKKTYPNLRYKFFISTNGTLLGVKTIQEWIYKMKEKHNLQLQLSHDGIGQYIRTQKFDPLYDERTKDFCVQLTKDNILVMFNTTLNKYNCSPIANKHYFDKWIMENGLQDKNLYIKLNHINSADYCKDFNLKGEELNRYMHELETLWMQAYIAADNDPLWKPYKGYFLNQMTRWETFRGWGGCAMFQLGMTETSWSFITDAVTEEDEKNNIASYAYCQLCNDRTSCPNPTLSRAESCKDCEFYWMDDCFPCPSMKQEEDCQYKKAYIRTVQRMKLYTAIVDSFRNAKNNSCKCGGKK